MAKKTSIYDKADKRLQKLAATVGAIVALISGAAAICSWVSNQFQAAVSAQINDFQQEVRNNDKADKQATTRLELMILIQHDPTNIVAIERMAKYYFQELNGDQYMTKMYSDWAKQYGGDTSIVIGGK